eukprot:15472267-Alexandrium_andersonii.AAC.1
MTGTPASDNRGCDCPETARSFLARAWEQIAQPGLARALMVEGAYPKGFGAACATVYANREKAQKEEAEKALKELLQANAFSAIEARTEMPVDPQWALADLEDCFRYLRLDL